MRAISDVDERFVQRVAASTGVCDCHEDKTRHQPEGGAVTARFLVLQHERRRRPALGPRRTVNMRSLNLAFGPTRGSRYAIDGDLVSGAPRPPAPSAKHEGLYPQRRLRWCVEARLGLVAQADRDAAGPPDHAAGTGQRNRPHMTWRYRHRQTRFGMPDGTDDSCGRGVTTNLTGHGRSPLLAMTVERTGFELPLLAVRFNARAPPP